MRKSALKGSQWCDEVHQKSTRGAQRNSYLAQNGGGAIKGLVLREIVSPLDHKGTQMEHEGVRCPVEVFKHMRYTYRERNNLLYKFDQGEYLAAAGTHPLKGTGMLNDPVVLNDWHVVAYAPDLKAEKPMGVRLLDEDAGLVASWRKHPRVA